MFILVHRGYATAHSGKAQPYLLGMKCRVRHPAGAGAVGGGVSTYRYLFISQPTVFLPFKTPFVHTLLVDI